MSKIKTLIAINTVILVGILSQSVFAYTSTPKPPGAVASNSLVPSINPIDTSSNLAVTGQLRRGRHFRGIVPYRSTTDFRASTPSSSLDSFLRDSAGSEDFGRYSTKYTPQPFHSPTRTVTSTRPGQTSIFSPSKISSAGTTIKDTTGYSSRRQETEYDYINYYENRPLASGSEQFQQNVLTEVEKYLQKIGAQKVQQSTHKQKVKQQDEKLLQFNKQLQDMKQKTEDLKKSLLTLDDPKQPQQREDKQPPTDKNNDPLNQLTLEELMTEEPLFEPQDDVYETMKLKIDSLYTVDTEKSITDVTESDKPSQQGSEEISPSQQPTLEQELQRVSLVASKAKKIMGQHKTFASFTNDKFNQCMRMAEQSLKDGKFYKAADAFTMATIYNPQNPLGYAGKSHSLLGAGEYMSSALFLSRAIKIFPEYAAVKVDIVSMIGSKDTLESRTAEIEQWAQQSEAGELYFLLGYIYYQTDKPDKANDRIDTACEKIPNDMAFLALKQAVESSMKKQ